MKEFFKKFTSIVMVIVTLLDMFLGPICVLASEVDAKAGDLRFGNDYKSEVGESVSVTEGSFKSEGDVEIRKTVTKLDENGKYEVKFEARGKDTSKTTYDEAPIYAVIVFDRSNSMTNKVGKWDNAIKAARAFAEGLLEKYSKANIAVVTFGTTAKTTQEFTNSNLKSTSDDTLFGYAPTNQWDVNGATNLHAGLEKAKTLLSSDKIEKDAKKYVIVISDGAPTKYGVNGDGGNSSDTSYKCIDYPVNTAKTLKKSGVEIFTVGYDLSSEIIYEGRNLGWNHPYRNSTAASILNLIATDSSHYVSSDKDNIVDKLKGIVSSTTVYSPAAKNLVIVDNIGKAFSSESDTDNDGKITLTLDKTTSEWQEVGKFEIQIDKNSTTGWHNTNDNFTYTWDGLGETKESTKNPEVYWVQPEYSYVIKHVEKDNKDNVLLTENGKANYGTNVEVKEKSFTGFTYDSKDKDFIEIDEDNNIAYVYYTRNSYNYTIKHVEKGNESNVLGIDSGSAKYKDIIEVKSKNFKGYTYNSKDKNSIVIDEKNNTATVYYVRNNYNYIIKHVEKGNESNVLGTDTGSANFEDVISVKSKEFKGFTYDSQDKDSIIIDVDNENNIATIYYTRNSYSYVIKHVEKGNEENVLGTESESANFEDVIDVKSKEFKGFTYDSQDKETIVIDTENNTATVYYTRNNYNYIIKHVEKGNESNVLGTDTGSANFEDVIGVKSREFKGFTYADQDKNSIIIDVDDGNNTATVYYTRNSYNYTIKHVELGNKNNVLDTESESANYNDTVEVKSKNFKGYTYDSKDKDSIVIDVDAENNIAYVYYVRNTYDYIIKHVELGNEENVLGTDTGSANFEDVISVKSKEFKGFTYDSQDKETIVIDTENNTATVYYTRNNYNYIIKHVEKGNESNVLGTDTGSANFEDVISVKSKEFKGFTYDSQDKETIVIDTENNTATVYYTRNNYNYIIKHVEKGNESNVLGTDTGSANFEDVISVKSKEFKGFTYDSQDKETIVIDTENNTATVYYTRNSYSYVIKHVEKGNESNVLDTENESANYNDIVEVKSKNFKGFTYDSQDKETIVIDTENNTATVYYTRNSYSYVIKHVEKGNESNVLGTDSGSANFEDVIDVESKEFKGFTYDSQDKETIVIDTEKNIAYVYYTRNKYSYTVEHYVETIDGKFELKDTDEINDVLYESKITYNVKNYKNYIYDESKTINPEYVINGNEVVKLYYVLGESEVIVHYVVKVDDNYIPFAKAAYDANGKLISNFEGVTLTDAKFVGKIGSEFKTDLRTVYEYAFIGIYDGNILIDTDIPKLDGDIVTGKIDFETREYTYVYESPKGGDVPVPPDTGINNFSYTNCLLLLAIAYLLKKYTTTEN